MPDPEGVSSKEAFAFNVSGRSCCQNAVAGSNINLYAFAPFFFNGSYVSLPQCCCWSFVTHISTRVRVSCQVLCAEDMWGGVCACVCEAQKIAGVGVSGVEQRKRLKTGAWLVFWA